jgi:hypothetical protein
MKNYILFRNIIYSKCFQVVNYKCKFNIHNDEFKSTFKMITVMLLNYYNNLFLNVAYKHY